MLSFFFNNNENIIKKNEDDLTRQKSINSNNSSPSSSPKINKDKGSQNNLNELEEDILKSLNINCSVINNIYQIQYKIENKHKEKESEEISKIIKNIEKKKKILINTTKNTYKYTNFSETQMDKINNYVEHFNKLLDISFQLVQELKC